MNFPIDRRIEKYEKSKNGSKNAVAAILRYGGIDGGHHKQWVIDQALRHILGDQYDAVIAEYNDAVRQENGETIEEFDPQDGWDEGIAP